MGLAALISFPVVGQATVASLSGGSGYSADLSANRAIRHQQLICDPEPGAGSATVTYDPNLVSLYSIFSEPGYSIDLNNTFVGVSNVGYMVTAQSFFANEGDLVERGRVQVTFTQSSLANCIGAPPTDSSTFTSISKFNPNDGGVNVFGLEFVYNSPDDTVKAPYTIFADKGGLPTLNADTFDSNLPPTAPDFLTGNVNGDQAIIPFTDIAPASVSGSLVPEPGALTLFGVGALGFLASRFQSAFSIVREILPF